MTDDAAAYRRDWALKTGRSEADIYVPQALRERELSSTAQQDVADHVGRHREVDGQMELPFEETVKQESGRRHEFVTGFALAKTPEGDWVFVGDITNVLDIERPPSDDEIRHGAHEAADYLAALRLVDLLRKAPVAAHSHSLA